MKNSFFRHRSTDSPGKCVMQSHPVVTKFYKGHRIQCYVDYYGTNKNRWQAYLKTDSVYSHMRRIDNCKTLNELFGKMKEKGLLA